MTSHSSHCQMSSIIIRYLHFFLKKREDQRNFYIWDIQSHLILNHKHTKQKEIVLYIPIGCILFWIQLVRVRLYNWAGENFMHPISNSIKVK